MLQEVKEIILRVQKFLEDDKNFSTEITNQGTNISVHPRNGDLTVYSGYELYLMELTVKKLGHELIFDKIQEDGFIRFAVGTDANFDLGAYIKRTNLKLRELQSDVINSVFIGEQTSDAEFEYNILTLKNFGTWVRCDLTRAEILYAAVFDLDIELYEDAVYLYPVLIDMSRKFFDEAEVAMGA